MNQNRFDATNTLAVDLPPSEPTSCAYTTAPTDTPVVQSPEAPAAADPPDDDRRLDVAEAERLTRQNLWPRMCIFQLYLIQADGECACSKPECRTAGKHPARKWSQLQAGEKDFRPSLRAGYGIATGSRSGDLVVIDLDIRPDRGIDGIATLAKLEASSLGPLPPTLETQSPSGGRLKYYTHPDAGDIKNSVGVVGAGIDVRGEGGMVVGPGSPHKKGGHYKVIHDEPIATLPERWATHLRPRPPKRPSARRASAPATSSATASGGSRPSSPTHSGRNLLTSADLERLATDGTQYAPHFQEIVEGVAFGAAGNRDDLLTAMLGVVANQYPLVSPESVGECFATSMRAVRAFDEREGNQIYESDYVAKRFADFVNSDSAAGRTKRAHLRMAGRAGVNADYNSADLSRLANHVGVGPGDVESFWILQRGSDFYFLSENGYQGPYTKVEFMPQARRYLTPASSLGVSLYEKAKTP